MFTYRCPSCGKQHVADKEPQEGFTTTCLRCRATIQVPGAALAAAGSAPSQPPPAEEAPPDEDVAYDEPETPRTDRKQSITRNPVPAKNGKPAPGKGKKAVKEAEPDDDDDAVDVPPPEANEEKGAKPGPKFAAKPSDGDGQGKRNLIIAGAAVLILALGVGAYFLFSGKKQPPKKPGTTARKPKDKTPKKPTTPVKKDKPPPPPVTGTAKNEAILKARNALVYHLSAARLADELANDSAATNAKYDGSTLVVTGGLAQLVQKESIRPPVRLHAVFAVAGPPIYADTLGGPTKEAEWKALTPGTVFTVRGAYNRNGLLHGCELLKGEKKEGMPPWQPSSPDARYRGKEVELSGFVKTVGAGTGGFPTLRFERETNGVLDVECYFAKTEEMLLKQVKVGEQVVVRGKCTGRNEKTIRLDNCKFSQTTAPEDTTPRVEIVTFLREYEEDFFPVLRPAPGKEERVEKEQTPRSLHKLVMLNPKGWEEYLGKILTVEGAVVARDKAAFTVTLGFEDTDKSFNVLCKFRRHPYEYIDDSANFRIRGLCTKMVDKQTLQLDNCEVDNPALTKDKRRLTADFLPHKAGQNVTYDVSSFPALSDNGVFRRLVCLQGENGLTTTVETHRSLAKSHSLFDPLIQQTWVKWRGARLLKPGPGPTFLRRVNGRYVEVGEVTRPGALPASWEPVLQIGARLGDKWKWTDKNITHEYKVFKFGEYKGRLSATIFETVRSPLMTVHATEVRHLYVEGLGEVERQEVLRISPTSTRILGEKKMVEEDAGKPQTPPKPPMKKESQLRVP